MLSSSVSFAQDSLWALHESQKNEVTDKGPRGFVFPNELNLDSYQQIWKSQNFKGAYVSVGSERSFIGAALSQAQAIVGVDMDPKITKFNHINAVLLAISTSETDYLTLRLHADFQSWQKRLEQSDFKNQIHEADWKWWQDIHKESDWQELFFSTKPTDLVRRFQGFVYWKDHKLWSHLHQLALNKKMGFFTLNLTDYQAVQDLAEKLDSLGITISAIDTSNVLEYIGAEQMVQSLLSFKTSESGFQWIYSQQRGADSFYGLTTSWDSKTLQEEPWIFGSQKVQLNKSSLQESIRLAMFSFPKPRTNFRCSRFFDPDTF